MKANRRISVDHAIMLGLILLVSSLNIYGISVLIFTATDNSGIHRDVSSVPD